MKNAIVHFLSDPYENGHPQSSNFICGLPKESKLWYSFHISNVNCKKCKKEYLKFHPEDAMKIPD